MPDATTTTHAGAGAPQASTGMLAQILGAQLVGPDSIVLDHVVQIEATNDDPTALTFIRSPKFAPQWKTSGAAAAIVTRGIDVPGHDPERRALLFVENADLAIITLLEMLAPEPTRPPAGVHELSVVHPDATVAPSASIGPGCTVGPGTTIGERAVLHANVNVGAGCTIADDVTIHPGTCIYDRCTIGPKSTLHARVVIGADGFGYRPAQDGSGLVKIPHLGGVRIGADVEIGPGACIDRGKLGDTTIGDNTKIDNLCQIGHNCTIGRSVIICGLCGIAGSVTIEDGAVLAGQVGIADNLTIGAGATIGAKSGVMSTVPAGSTWFGYPARPKREAATGQALLRRMAMEVLGGRNTRRDERAERDRKQDNA